MLYIAFGCKLYRLGPFGIEALWQGKRFGRTVYAWPRQGLTSYHHHHKSRHYSGTFGNGIPFLMPGMRLVGRGVLHGGPKTRPSGDMCPT